MTPIAQFGEFGSFTESKGKGKGKGKGDPGITPEPSTYGLVLVGLCLLIVWVARVKMARRES